MNKKDYGNYVKSRAAKSPILKNCSLAFLVGGGICGAAELLLKGYLRLGASEEAAPLCVTVTLIALSACLTGIGIFDRIARFAGAGTLVPVTGFANAVVSPAIDTKAEGMILGVGAKIFTVAGPVLLYAVLSGSLYGVIYYILTWIL